MPASHHRHEGFPDPRAGDGTDTKPQLRMALLDVAIWAFLIAVAFAGLLTPP